MRCLAALILCCFSMGPLFSEAEHSHCCDQNESVCTILKPHALYALPLVMGAHVQLTIEQAAIQSNRALGGGVLGYQYLQHHRPYINVEVGCALGGSAIPAYLNEVAIPTASNHPIFIEAELRLGYPYFGKQQLFIPFIGGGWYALTSWDHQDGFESFCFFGSLGFKLPYMTSKLCHIGLMAELLVPVGMDFTYTGITSSYQKNITSLGCRLSLPCTWSPCSCSPWDVRFEPFFLMPTFAEQQLFYGITGGLMRYF